MARLFLLRGPTTTPVPVIVIGRFGVAVDFARAFVLQGGFVEVVVVQALFGAAEFPAAFPGVPGAAGVGDHFGVGNYALGDWVGRS